jgi:hypothetical protein
VIGDRLRGLLGDAGFQLGSVCHYGIPGCRSPPRLPGGALSADGLRAAA